MEHLVTICCMRNVYWYFRQISTIVKKNQNVEKSSKIKLTNKGQKTKEKKRVQRGNEGKEKQTERKRRRIETD